MDTFFLVCFFVGLLLTVFSAFLGAIDSGLDMPDATGDGTIGKSVTISPVNFHTIVAFSMCFGGAGYLLVRYTGIGSVLALAGAAGAGLGGSRVIWSFLRLLYRGETATPAGRDHLVGIRGRLTISIRENGTGELIYILNGVRQVCAARSDGTQALYKGEEVVVQRYERGIAYVRPVYESQAKEE